MHFLPKNVQSPKISSFVSRHAAVATTLQKSKKRNKNIFVEVQFSRARPLIYKASGNKKNINFHHTKLPPFFFRREIGRRSSAE